MVHGAQPHQPSPASVYWPALHPVIDRDPRAGPHSLRPFPGITTEDRECVMRLILLFSFVLKKAARSGPEWAAP